MEIYRAIADFTPPKGEGTENLLSFSKGDKFVVFEGQKEQDWWGVRSLDHNTVGYVPSNYLRHNERKIGKLVPATETGKTEAASKKPAEMQSAVDSRTPETYLGKKAPPKPAVPALKGLARTQEPSVPSPDYESEGTPPLGRKQGRTLKSQEAEYEEPPPDYQTEDDNDPLPPPPPESAYPPPPPPDEHSVPPPPPVPIIMAAENGGGEVDESGLIRAHRLQNPCLASKERMALHRELLHNHKMGKNVLEKPELDQALRKRKETQRIKEWDSQKNLQRTSLELKLEERANRLKEEEVKMNAIPETEEKTPEYLKVHKKITAKTGNPAGQ